MHHCAEWNLAQHTTRTQHTQLLIFWLYFSNTTHMLHSCVYTCTHKYTHVELHNSHRTLKIGYFSWKFVIFLVFVTQFSTFPIAIGIWTAECADKWLIFVHKNKADKKMEILFLGSWKLEIMTYFWLNSVKIHDFDTHFLKSCVLMWHKCPHMSILGLQIHNTYTTRVELSTTQHTYSTYTQVYFFTSFFKYITQVQFWCVHNLYTCIHM